MQTLPDLKKFMTELQLSDIDAEIKRREYQRAQHLNVYIRQSWRVIEPATEYLHNWHIDLICEYLEACKLRQIKRLIINIPPRSIKSTAVTVNFPTWLWTMAPHERFMFASYSQGLSTKHSIDRRDIIQSDWYQQGWGKVFQLTEDQNQKTEFRNDHAGHMIATSMTGTSTGKGCNFLIVDDPHNPLEAESDLQRDTAIESFDRTLSTRLDNKKQDVIIVVMQRLHEKDLTGHLLAQGGWQNLCLPAIEEKRTVYYFPVSKTEKVREEGDILWPDREGPDELAQAKRQLGSYGFAGQYQQQPSPSGGGIVKRSWWRTYRKAPDDFEKIIQSWDCTFKDAETSDFVVGQVWGKKGADAYLLDQVRGKWNITSTLQEVVALSAKWPKSSAKYVEDKANGTAVIALLKQKVPGLLPVNPEGGKIVRANAVSPYVESGNVYVPEESDYISDFLGEWDKFPNGDHDDQVDACTQALNQLFFVEKFEFFYRPL